MKKNQLIVVFGSAFGLALMIFAIYHFYNQRYGSVTFEFNGSCLNYKPSEVEIPKGQYLSAQTGPYFWVSAPISGSARKSMGENGFIVQFRKNDPSVRDRFLSEQGENRRGCPTTPSAHGLLQRLDRGENSCSLSRGYDHFEAENKMEQDSAVALSCSNNKSMLNCSMRYYMENNWTAIVSLPKVDLENWRIASASSRRFFYEKLVDCGGSNELQ